MPSGIKTNIKSASMHPYQRWAEMNETQGTAVNSIVPAAATIPGFLLGFSSPFTYPHTISRETGVMRLFPVFYLVLGGCVELLVAMPPGHKYFSVQSEQRTVLLLLISSSSGLAWRTTTFSWYRTWRAAWSTLLLVSACSFGLFFLYSLLLNKDLAMHTETLVSISRIIRTLISLWLRLQSTPI